MKLIVKAQSAQPHKQINRNVAAAPECPPPQGRGCLAIVGGGPSVSDNLSQLWDWKGDIWSINGVFAYLRSHGVPSTFMTVDANPTAVRFAQGAVDAVLHERVDPSLWMAVKNPRKITGPVPGPTSAVAACYAAIMAGYSHIVLFGCESSYAQRHHAYECDADYHSALCENSIWIACNGQEFRTKPEYYAQAEQLANIVRTLPTFFSEQSGGLLRALIDNPDHDVTHVTAKIAETLVPLEEQARTQA